MDSETKSDFPRIVALETLSAPRRPDAAPRPVGIVAGAAETRLETEVGLDIKFGNPNICPSTAIAYQGGALGSQDPVQLLFWGSIWQTLPDITNPGQLLINTFIAAVKSTLAGPWMSGLRQYGIKRCSFGGALIVTSPNPPFAPGTFGESNVQNLVGSLIGNGTFPEPDDPGGRILYVVLMPPNTVYSPGGARGAHSSFWTGGLFDNDTAWYAWVGSQSLPQMTSTFTHELAEMCTDPEPNSGWVVNGASNSCSEIGDLCNNVNGVLNGVVVESYWSNFDGACLITTTWSVRRMLIWAGKTLGGQGLRSIQNPISSLNQFIVNI